MHNKKVKPEIIKQYIIEHHAHRQFDAGHLAAMMQSSRQQVNKVCKANYGCKTSELIAFVRITKATELMNNNASCGVKRVQYIGCLNFEGCDLPCIPQCD